MKFRRRHVTVNANERDHRTLYMYTAERKYERNIKIEEQRSERNGVGLSVQGWSLLLNFLRHFLRILKRSRRLLSSCW